jgi:hypothetical protein
MPRKNIPPGATVFTLPMGDSSPLVTGRPNPVVRRPAVPSRPLPDQNVGSVTLSPMSFKNVPAAGVKIAGGAGGAVHSPSIFSTTFAKGRKP